MVTLMVLLAAAFLVLCAGEAVRGQCRRMLSRPIPLVGADDVAVDQAAPATAMAA